MLTIRSLVQNRSLELTVLVEGPSGSLDADVSWVHNTELPDPAPYLRERELVLTNGLWHTGARSSNEFVASLTGCKAAGLVFGLREEVPTTPTDLIDACEQAGLPLVEISVPVPFTAVTEAAAAAYAERRQQRLVGMVRRGNTLADAISRDAGASGVLGLLRRDHELPLAVVDRMARPLAVAGAELDAAQLRTVADALARNPPPLEVDLGPAGRAAMFLVGAVGDVDAALVCLRPANELGRAEQDALDQAARFLSLEVARQQAVQAIEARFASELLDMILSGSRRAAELPGRLQAFGVDAADPLAVCALAFSAGEITTLPGVAEAASDFFIACGTPAVVAPGSQDVVVVFPWRQPRAELARLAGRLVTAVEQRFPAARPVAGLGGVVAGADALRRPLLEAREACQVLRRRRGSERVATFAELGTHRLLLGLQDQETLRGFADGVLTPLRAHDAQRGGDLELSLRTFLDHDGQWAPTAAELHVHVNTLRNRIARITELTGRDVMSTEGRVDLFLALEADAMIDTR